MASLEHLPNKRCHIEDADTNNEPLKDNRAALNAESNAFAHRKALRGRAILSNAADNPLFSNHHALVFHFVDAFDIEKGGKGKGSTSNMRTHMLNKHTLVWENAEKLDDIALGISHGAEKISTKTEEVQNTPPFNIDEWYRLLTQWIVTGNHSFTEVENEEFQRLMVFMKPALEEHIVRSQAIRDQIIKHAAILRDSTRNYLTSLSGLMAISCDSWTSPNRIAFLAIMGSWITEDWNLEETLLNFVELRGAHDGQNMAAAVASSLIDLGISDKLLALVTDNASNNGTLVRHLASFLGHRASHSRWDPEKGQIRCLAHIIHPAVMSLLRGIDAVPLTTDLRDFNPQDHALAGNDAEDFVASDNKEALESDETEEADLSVNLSSAIDKIRKIAKLVRSSPQRMEFFRGAAAQIEAGHEQKAKAANQTYVKKTTKTLILDVMTRWNSVFLMLERALEFSETINYLTGHAKVAVYRPYALSTDEWGAVLQVCKWLQFFRSASTLVAAEKYLTLSFSLRVYFLLILYVLDLEKSPAVKQFPSLAAGVSSCKEKLLEYFDKSTCGSEYYYSANPQISS
ncbi:hAT family dimerization protein [Ceratobasidium sp. AG-Ba]|nr:hAT family dimerization protein [Ceratobasidium sp. AG-Ba]